MKSKLAVGINVYQDTPGLKRCIDSLYEHVDLVVVVDGKYPDWGSPDDPILSNDGIATMLASYDVGKGRGHSKKISLQEMPNTPQHIKRSKYLQIAGQEHCSHLLVIDADEFVRSDSDWKLFRYELDNHPRFEQGLQGNTQYSHNIAYQAQPNNRITLARLIYKPGELEYRSHWLLYRIRDGSPTAYQNVGDQFIVQGITITTDEGSMIRSPSRIQSDIDYQWMLFLKEEHITYDEYINPEAKKKFADHIIWEVEQWKKLRPIA